MDVTTKKVIRIVTASLALIYLIYNLFIEDYLIDRKTTEASHYFAKYISKDIEGLRYKSHLVNENTSTINLIMNGPKERYTDVSLKAKERVCEIIKINEQNIPTLAFNINIYSSRTNGIFYSEVINANKCI